MVLDKKYLQIKDDEVGVHGGLSITETHLIYDSVKFSKLETEDIYNHFYVKHESDLGNYFR